MEVDVDIWAQPVTHIGQQVTGQARSNQAPILSQDIDWSRSTPNSLFYIHEYALRLVEILIIRNVLTDSSMIEPVKGRHHEIDETAIAVARNKNHMALARRMNRRRERRRAPVREVLPFDEFLVTESNADNSGIIDASLCRRVLHKQPT